MIADRLLSIQNLFSNFRICTRSCINMAIRGCKFKDFCPATWSRCNYPPAAPLAAKTFFSFTKRLPSEILEKKNAMYQRIAQTILSQVLHFTYYNFSYLKHPTIRCVLSTFLDASSHLYKRVCPSVRPSVRRSVRPSVRNAFVRSEK